MTQFSVFNIPPVRTVSTALAGSLPLRSHARNHKSQIVTKMSQKNNDEREFPIQPYNLKQMEAIYNVCTRTFSGWIRPHKETIGVRTGNIYTSKQVETIVQ